MSSKAQQPLLLAILYWIILLMHFL